MKKKTLQYYMRAIHRVLGYFTIGLVIVYALSGIILIHRSGDFMRRTENIEETIAPGLNGEALTETLKLHHMKVTDETDTQILFTDDGKYDKQTGKVEYSKTKVVAPFDKFVALHVASDKKNQGVAVFTTLFGVVLCLLALTSLFMYKTGSKPFKANMIYTLLGIVLTVVLILVL